MVHIPHRVLVSFIMLDPDTNIPISGSEAVKILGDMQTLEAFETAGFQASEFTAPGDDGSDTNVSFYVCCPFCYSAKHRN